jgi:hypothetical protein
LLRIALSAGEVILENSSQFTAMASQFLNKILFGAGVTSDQDFMSQWTTLATAYLVNMALIFIVIAGGGVIVGYYDPFHEPLVRPQLRQLLALSNIIVFALMYIASLEWKMHDAVLGRQRLASHSKGIYLFFLITFSVISIFFSAVLFFLLSFPILLAVASVNSILLHLLLFERSLKSKSREVN